MPHKIVYNFLKVGTLVNDNDLNLSACTGGQTSDGVAACACPAAASGQAVDATSGNCQCQPNTVLNGAGDTCEGKCDKCYC